MDKEKISLSVAQWHELAQKGTILPMRIPINGVSMYPLIRRNRDMVSILPIQEEPAVGDIVLFSDPQAKERYVLHRLWRIEQDRVQTWGDNCDGPDRWMPRECLWGKAVLIERGRLRIRPDTGRGLLLARLWHPAGRCLRRGRGFLYACWKRIRPWIKKETGEPRP